jgi:predicted PurR-regulated permease PerM
MTDRPHLWDYRWVRDLLLILAVVILLCVLYSVREITIPILIGFGLAYVVNPIPTWTYRAWRWPRWFTTVLIMSVGMVIFLSLLLYLVPPLYMQAGMLKYNAVEFSSKLWANDLLPRLGTLAEEAAAESTGSVAPNTDIEPVGAPAAPTDDPVQAVLGTLANIDMSAVGGVVLASLGVGVGAVGVALGLLTYMVLAAVIIAACFFFFCWHFPRIIEWFRPFIPASERQRTLAILAKMDASVAAFIRGRLIQALVMGIILCAGWWLVGVPYWLLLGLLCGLLNLVPFVAAVGWIATVVLMTMHVWGATPQVTPAFLMSAIVWPSVVYFVAQLLDGWVVEPLVQGHATNLDPLTVLLAVIIGGSIAGLFGMLLAIPVAACSRILAIDVILPRLRAFAAER